jgi:hypothetical protein
MQLMILALVICNCHIPHLLMLSTKSDWLVTCLMLKLAYMWLCRGYFTLVRLI